MLNARAHAGRRHRRGMTLIEITIGLAIAAMAAGLAVVSVNALTHSALRSSSLELTGAIKFCYDRAIMEKRTQRIAMDLDKNIWWVEYTEDPYALAKERLSGTEGEQNNDEGEKKEKRDSFFDRDADEEVKRSLEGGKAARFVPDEGGGEPHPLPGDIRFSSVWAGHQEEPFTSGIAYLHFFRGGWTEPAQIELTDGDEFSTLRVMPLTGRVRSYPKQLDKPEVDEHDGREEGDE